MVSWKDRLEQMARRSLNELQDRVVAFDEQGGLDAFIDRLTEQVRQQQNRLLDGEHPMNPEYRQKVACWYSRLELEQGADEVAVRKAYRSLMRKFHPDRFANSERGEELATRLSQELTVAYTGLIRHLNQQ